MVDLRDALSQFGTARAADAADAIDGVLPRAVVEPESPEALAAVLAYASRARASVVLRGGGTKLGWGRPPAAIDVVISTRRLNRVLTHAHGDLTATVEAGAALVDVNRELMRHRQWLPIDVTDDGATIGGAIASNDSGPARHRYGTPRDLLIGVHLATADGRIVKAGGTVVKNVAGYDLGKLMSGSFGTLAAIVTATFKLAPLPTAAATAIVGFSGADGIVRAAAAIAGSQLEPAAFDLHGHWGAGALAASSNAGRTRSGPPSPYHLLIQFASTRAAVDAQLDEVRRLIGADSLEVMTGEAEAELWRNHTRAVWRTPGVVVRVSWLPATLEAVFSLLHDIAGRERVTLEFCGRTGVGAGAIRIGGDAPAVVAAVSRLRERSDLVGHVVLLTADVDTKRRVDVWGPGGDHAALLAAVKRAFDPAGILNAGRGPV